ncbi:uncharacterized protein LOC123327084 [Drosophila simulans]|uniref:Uncharacterized protein, isoform C n=1 Tax=Drosophila simulans TaxID=7240 RepID=A0A0J9U697_DROSI|nr:uncharacterized protein LOC123327084 [Drosophila simulans]KMY95125.1 uncharacterized protein Dsimw501_GD26779, isoform C [Drosophila simulans]
MTTENSATTVTTRMKWNLILKQAFDHRCCMLATFAIVAAADVDCNSVDVASERASLAFLPKFCVWEGRCCCCCCSYSKTTTTHPIKIVCNLQGPMTVFLSCHADFGNGHFDFYTAPLTIWQHSPKRACSKI